MTFPTENSYAERAVRNLLRTTKYGGYADAAQYQVEQIAGFGTFVHVLLPSLPTIGLTYKVEGDQAHLLPEKARKM